MIQNQKIRNEIDTVHWNNHESVIDFYESNILYFENKTDFVNKEEIEDFANIQISYVLALDQKKHYTKAAKQLLQTEKIINKLDNSPAFAKVNERFMFASGVISHRLRKYNDSLQYFSKLIKIDPENDLYKDWYESNYNWVTNKRLRIVGYIGTAILFWNILFGDFINMPTDIRLKLDIVALVMIVGGFYGRKIIKLIKK